MELDQIAAFNADYALAQSKCENPHLDSTNPAFKSRFASLAATRNEVVPTFAACGIAIQQTPVTEMVGDRLFAGVHTQLRHKSGHVEDLGRCLMPVQKFDAQGIASCLTYAKRQSLQALAGVTGEQDDDANQATGKAVAAIKPGIGIHSPLGDVEPTDEALKWADSIRESIGNPDRIMQIRADLNAEGEELYRAVWSLLDSKVRSAFKKIVEQSKVAA